MGRVLPDWSRKVPIVFLITLIGMCVKRLFSPAFHVVLRPLIFSTRLSPCGLALAKATNTQIARQRHIFTRWRKKRTRKKFLNGSKERVEMLRHRLLQISAAPGESRSSSLLGAALACGSCDSFTRHVVDRWMGECATEMHGAAMAPRTRDEAPFRRRPPQQHQV